MHAYARVSIARGLGLWLGAVRCGALWWCQCTPPSYVASLLESGGHRVLLLLTLQHANATRQLGG